MKMKFMKMFSCLISLLIFVSVQAQVINADFPVGVYKMYMDTSDLGVKFIFDKEKNFQILINTSGYEFTVRGDYEQNNDTLFLSFDPVYLFAVKDDSISSSDELQINILKETNLTSMLMLDQNPLKIYKNSDTIPLLLSNESISLSWKKTDSLHVKVQTAYDNGGDLYYTVPAEFNRVNIMLNIEGASSKEKLKVIKSKISPNLLELIASPNIDMIIPLYFIEPFATKLESGQKLIPFHTEYEKLTTKTSFEQKKTKIFDTYSEALIAAKEEHKLIRLYNADLDSVHFQKLFDESYLSYYTEKFVFANVKDSSLHKGLSVFSPQGDVLFTDSISLSELTGIKEGDISDNKIFGYLQTYRELLDKRISDNGSDKEFLLKEYLNSSLHANAMVGYQSDTISNNTEKYLNMYISDYCGYSPDSLIYNYVVTWADNNISSSLDTVIQKNLPEYQKYLILNRKQNKLLDKELSRNLRFVNGQNTVLGLFFLTYMYPKTASFSLIKEALSLIPEYEDYLYMMYLVGKDESFTDSDIKYIKKYMDTIANDITVSTDVSSVYTHSAMEVINEKAKKMFEFDSTKYLFVDATATAYTDIYEISQVYNDMFAMIFNNFAWRVYRSGHGKKYLNDLLKYSLISLDLEPDNHYYLDTYAHLLYLKGDVKKAIEFEQKAYDRAKKDDNFTTLTSNLYKLRLRAMELGILEKYNTDEWNK